MIFLLPIDIERKVNSEVKALSYKHFTPNSRYQSLSLYRPVELLTSITIT